MYKIRFACEVCGCQKIRVDQKAVWAANFVSINKNLDIITVGDQYEKEGLICLLCAECDDLICNGSTGRELLYGLYKAGHITLTFVCPCGAEDDLVENEVTRRKVTLDEAGRINIGDPKAETRVTYACGTCHTSVADTQSDLVLLLLDEGEMHV